MARERNFTPAHDVLIRPNAAAVRRPGSARADVHHLQSGGYSWTWFAATLLLPDIVLPGYLAGHRFGAIVYNLVHTYLSPLMLSTILYLSQNRGLYWIPLIWIAHIGMDRMIGYGLRYPTSFKDTHLARA